MRIITVIGARPQFVKAAVVSRALAAEPGVTEQIVHTGQHYDENLSDVFFEEMGIPRPFCNLQAGSGSHGGQTGRMLADLERVLLAERPDAVLVYGDTNSTLAGALAAVKLHIPVAHVEAGVRSFNRAMPEEINRVLTDHASDMLLAPTPTAIENLTREGLSQRAHLVGDVMWDAVIQYRRAAEKRGIVERLGVTPGNYVLATVHRAENTDNERRLRAIVSALTEISSHLPVVLPLHPRTQNAIDRQGLQPRPGEGPAILAPVGYLDMMALQLNAAAIVTDSGGVQKEAYFCEVPCITIRDETEWPELVSAGWNRLAPPNDKQPIVDAVFAALGTRGVPASVFGDGRASEKIARILLRHVSGRERPLEATQESTHTAVV